MPVMGYAPLAVVPWIGEPGAAGRSRAIRVVGWFQERRAAIGRRSGSGPMCSWRELATEAPELAGASRARFEATKHHVLATLRWDGSPRVRGTEIASRDAGRAQAEMLLGSMWGARHGPGPAATLSLIHISEPTRLGMISYAVFCLKKQKTQP